MLLIDDSRDLLTLFQRLLETAGYRVTTSHTLLSREQVLSIAPDVLVLELVTPVGADQGWDYLTLLRRDPEIGDLPIVLCTTAGWHVRQPPMAAWLDRQVAQVLLKPCRPAELVAAVAEALRSQHITEDEQAS